MCNALILTVGAGKYCFCRITRGCTHDHACHSHQTIDRPRILTKPGRSTPGFHRTRLALSHQARSAVVYSASRMKVELHPAKIVLPEVGRGARISRPLIYHWRRWYGVNDCRKRITRGTIQLRGGRTLCVVFNDSHRNRSVVARIPKDDTVFWSRSWFLSLKP